MAVINKISNNWSAKIDPHLHARIWAFTAPERHIHRVEELPLLRRHWFAVLLQQQEMGLMDVKFVNFFAPVLDRPVLNRTPRGGDCWRIVRIECHRSLANDCNEEGLFLVRP